MTQLVAAGNWTYAVVVADRRYTVNGVLVNEADDERNKVIVVSTPTARLAVAFCGLARADAFSTEPWLARLLYDASAAGGGMPDLDLICRRADEMLSTLSLPAGGRRIDARCLWIVLAGFISERDAVAPVYAFVNNAQPTADGCSAGPFRHEVYGPSNREQRAYAMSMGAAAVPRQYVDQLKRLVLEDRPARAAVGGALRTIRAARTMPQAAGRIGDRCGAAVVWSEPERQPEGWYFGGRRSSTHFMPTLVTQHGVITDFSVDRRAVPAARNAPCSCGSGRPYRRCHGASFSSVRGITTAALPTD